MSYVVRQLLISDSLAVQELVASRNGTKYYSTERMISSEKLNAIFADPVNLYVSKEHTTGIDYDPVKDLIYVGAKSTALIGLFDNNNLVAFTAIRNISEVNRYYGAIFFMMSHLKNSSVEKNTILLKKTIEKLHNTGSVVIYLSVPTKFRETSYHDITKDYDTIEIVSNSAGTLAKSPITKKMILDNAKPFWYYDNSIYVMRKK
jgi:hypothetical protein